ncbi:MAG: sulfatase, partial [bacterium]
YSAFLTVVLGARVYRIHWGKLVDEAVWTFGLLALGTILLFSFLGFRKKWRYWAPVPIYGFCLVFAVIIVISSPDPSYQVSKPRSTPNIVWITSDTLRSDHLSQYGYEHDVFGKFDRWKEDFVQFNQSYSTASWTAPSVASHLTSLYPLQHGKSKGSLMNKNIVTLPQVLHRVGYHTRAISNQPLVSPGWGFGKGFDRFASTSTVFMETTFVDILNEFWLEEQMVEYVSPLNLFYGRFQATKQTPAGLWETFNSPGYTESLAEPFFLYLYFFDPHSPYNPGKKWYPSGTLDVDRTKYFYQSEYAKPDGKPASEVKKDIVRRYDGEINDVAHKVDKILSYLKKRGLYKESLIVFTSDHGEKFYDHGGWLHGGTLYQEVTRVPLFVKFPDNEHAGQIVEEPVDGVDIYPTILQTLGVSVKLPYQLRGERLVKNEELVRDLTPPIMELIGNRGQNYEIAMVKNGRKFFITETSGTVTREAYRLRGRNSIEWEPITNSFDTSFRRLGTIVRDHQDFPFNPYEIGQTQREQLKALGYID